MKKIKSLLLSDRFILSIILINSCIIWAQVDGVHNLFLNIADAVCTLIFLAEMIVKHRVYGVRGYWSDGWNRLDGLLVILSLPSVLALFVPNELASLSMLMIFRLLRVLRFVRVLHFFPNFGKIMEGFKLALRQSKSVLMVYVVLIVIFGLVNCSLFKEADPAHFATPLRSIYAVFQICTVEGWYEIPNAIADYYGSFSFAAGLVRLYFCLLLIIGGIIGMSFINSIFVDAMVADNNDEMLAKLNQMQQTLDELKHKLDA